MHHSISPFSQKHHFPSHFSKRKKARLHLFIFLVPVFENTPSKFCRRDNHRTSSTIELLLFLRGYIKELLTLNGDSISEFEQKLAASSARSESGKKWSDSLANGRVFCSAPRLLDKKSEKLREESVRAPQIAHQPKREDPGNQGHCPPAGCPTQGRH